MRTWQKVSEGFAGLTNGCLLVRSGTLPTGQWLVLRCWQIDRQAADSVRYSVKRASEYMLTDGTVGQVRVAREEWSDGSDTEGSVVERTHAEANQMKEKTTKGKELSTVHRVCFTSDCLCWWRTWCGYKCSCTFHGLLCSLWHQKPDQYK